MSLKAKTLPSFDPQLVPVVGVDSHLQAVDAEALTPQALRQRFLSQPEWSPELRAEQSGLLFCHPFRRRQGYQS